MTIKYKSGDIGTGSWVTVPAGNLGYNNGGIGSGSWILPQKVYYNNGGIGSGSWVDTGYEAFPDPPKNFAINSWSYSTLSVKWTAPTSGAAVSTYEIELRNKANNTTLQSRSDSASPSANFSVSEMTDYYVRIRSKTAAGLTSAWVYIKPSIGRPKVISQRWVQKTRAWSNRDYVDLWRNNFNGPRPPAKSTHPQGGFDIGVYVTGTMGLELYAVNGFTSELVFGERAAWFLKNSSAVSQVPAYQTYTRIGEGFKSAPLPGGTNAWSNGGYWGLWLDGSGWSSAQSGSYRLTGYITISGTEYYGVEEDYVSQTEVVNSYW